MKAAAIISKDILESKVEFGSIFDEDCQLKSLPKTLFSFVNMVLFGKITSKNIGFFCKYGSLWF